MESASVTGWEKKAGCICKASELVWLVAELGGGRASGKRGAERQRAGGRKGPIWGEFITSGETGSSCGCAGAGGDISCRGEIKEG